MIIVRLRGGLGNQMFQYAAAKSLAFRLQDKLFLDRSFYKFNLKYLVPRRYGLNCFKLKANFVSAVLSFLAKNGISFKKYVEKYTEYNRSFTRIKGENIYFDGYWQSERYFLDIEKELRKDFVFNKDIISDRLLLNKIGKTNSVSIHHRKTDYLETSKRNIYTNLSRTGYYKKAIAFINNNVSNPVYYIFSDDISWCKNNVKIKNAHFVESSSKECEDMMLMSKCKHNIIANSSYSWWAAWLNKNPNKIIICPKKWWKHKRTNIEDHYPKDWSSI